jgi:hypothetical protein
MVPIGDIFVPKPFKDASIICLMVGCVLNTNGFVGFQHAAKANPASNIEPTVEQYVKFKALQFFDYFSHHTVFRSRKFITWICRYFSDKPECSSTCYRWSRCDARRNSPLFGFVESLVLSKRDKAT